jgi:hypothetical protein
MPIYALIPLVQDRDHEHHRSLQVFERGDLLSGHFTPEALAWLVEHEQASAERPDDVTPAYSLIDNLTYHGPGAPAGGRFRRGDRVDGILPGPLLRQVIARGDASHQKPKAA